MLLCIGLAEAQATPGGFLEPPIPVGVQRHMCDPCREVCSICWGTRNLIKLQEPGKGGLAKGQPTVGPFTNLVKQVPEGLWAVLQKAFEIAKPGHMQLVRGRQNLG